MMVYRRMGMLVLALVMVALWAHGPVWAQDGGTGQVSASASLTDANGQQVGVVQFTDEGGAGTVRVTVQVQNMPPGFQELVLTSVGQCDAAGTPPYSSAGDPLNLDNQQYPFRAGDLLPVFVMQNGTGQMSFVTDRFTTADLMDADGAAVLVRLGAALLGAPMGGEQVGQAGGDQGQAGQSADMTATPEMGQAGGGQTTEMTETPQTGETGGGEAAEMTATPEGGEAAGGETMEMTATPEAGQAGGDQQSAEATPTAPGGEAGSDQGQAGQAADMTATPLTGQTGSDQGQVGQTQGQQTQGQQAGQAQGQQPMIGVVGEYFACGVVMQGDVTGGATMGGAEGQQGAGEMTATPQTGEAGGQQGAEMTATPQAGQSQGETAGGAAQGEPITVSLVDGSIDMPASIPGGSVTFQVTNNGSMEHGFVIEGVDDASFEQSLDQNLQPGESATLQVDLQPGAYRVYCPVDDHANQGMQLDLTVTQGAQ